MTLVMLLGVSLIAQVPAAPSRTSASSRVPPPSQAQLLQEGLRLLETRGEPKAAAAVFERAASGPDRKVAARARLYAGIAYEKLGQQQARGQYERVLREFGDQPDVVAEARARLAALARLGAANALAAKTVTLRKALAREPPTLQWFGAVTRDGRALTYGDEQGFVGVVEFASPDTPRVAVAAGSPGEDAGPGPTTAVPSPDGTAFLTEWRTRAGATELRLTRAGGTRETVLTIPGGQALAGLDWPSRNHAVAQVLLPDRRAELPILDLPSASARRIATLARPPTRASLSPDGKWLVYDALPDGAALGGDLFILDTSTSQSRPLVSEPSDDAMPAWTARGDWVLFLSDRSGATGLWGVPMAGGQPAGPEQLLQQDLGRMTMLLGVTSADQYHYLRQVGMVDVYTVELGDAGRPQGAPQGAAQSFVGSNMMPTYAPDGRSLAYLAQMGFSAREVVGVRDHASGTQRNLTTGMSFLRIPEWSPDGTRLLVKGNDASGRFGFHLVDVGTGATTPVVIVPPDKESSLGLGRWSPDGTSVIYTQWLDERTRFLRRTLADGTTDSLFTIDEGSWVTGVPGFDVATKTGDIAMLVGKGTSSAIVVRDRSGETREIARFTGVERPTGLAWAPDATAIYLTRPVSGNRGIGSVWRQPLDGSAAIPLGLEMPGLRNIAVRPDGRQLAFTAGAPLREPWVLEHFLPAPTKAASKGAVR